MPNFIGLHSGGDEITVNMNLVESFGIINDINYPNCNDDLGKTYLVMTGMTDNEKVYVIDETPEQIRNLIYKYVK